MCLRSCRNLLFILFITISDVSAQLQKPIRTFPPAPSTAPAPSPSPKPALPSPPPSLSMLVLSSPNGGESWVTGTQHDITWNRSNDMTGFITIDLYRGGTSAQNKIGTIASGISVTTGKYSWTVGNYQGGTTPAGNNYRVIISAGGKTDPSNGPFTIVPKLASAPPVSPSLDKDLKKTEIPTSLKRIYFTYPRRGDSFHKGIGYKVTWKSFNLNDAKLKLELWDNQEATLIQTINGIENTGETMWFVDNSLPDEQTLYKLKIQTMDGAQKDTVGPIRISKGTVPPKSLKVTNPTMGDRAFGDTIPVKWTSSVACSGSGGPYAAFRVELIKVDDKGYPIGNPIELTDVGYIFDNEGPTGYLNWHWDWYVSPNSCQPGTYKVKVSSMISSEASCSGSSDKFRILDAQERKTYELIGKRKLCGFLHKCVYCGNYSKYDTSSWLPRFLHDDEIAGIGEYPLIGYHYVYKKNATIGNVGEGFNSLETVDKLEMWVTVRSTVTFSDDLYWYKKMGFFQEAKLVLTRKWKTPYATTQNPALGGVALETRYGGCEVTTLHGMLPINASASLGDTFEIDVSAHYRNLIQKGKPDFGIILYPRTDYSTTCNNDCIRRNAENYEVILKARFI